MVSPDVALGNRANQADVPHAVSGEQSTGGESFVSRIMGHINGSSARRVGFRYLFGDFFVMASAAALGNLSKFTSGLFGVLQSVGFFLDSDKDKNRMAERIGQEMLNAIDNIPDALLREGQTSAPHENGSVIEDQTLRVTNALRFHGRYNTVDRVWHLAQDQGVNIGSAAMMGAGATMFNAGLRGGDIKKANIGEMMNGAVNIVGFAMNMIEGQDKPEGYRGYEMKKDPSFPEMLQGLGHLITHPKLAVDMLRYDPSELGKYLTASTSVFGLLAGVQELFQPGRSKLAGVMQLLGSGCYIWGEMGMGGISQEKLHRHLGTQPDQDFALLESAGVFESLAQKLVDKTLLQAGKEDHNRRVLDAVGELFAGRYQMEMPKDRLIEGVAQHLPPAYKAGVAA